MVISDLFGASGRRFLDALVAGERSPAALAALGDKRLRATRAELRRRLTGRFRDIHAFEIAVHLRLIDAICAEITALDEQIGQQLALVPRHGAGLRRVRAGRRRPRPRTAQTTARRSWAWPGGWTRSPASAPSTAAPSSPSSAPTPPSSPPPGTPPAGPG